MIRYYLKMAWRDFCTNKMFSMLNLMGLSIAIAICIPLFLFICKQYSFDSGFAKKDQIYRVNLLTHDDEPAIWASVPNAVAPALMQDLPEVEYAARMFKNGFGTPASLRVGRQNYKEDLLYWCDPEFFRIFDLRFIAGNADMPLIGNNSVAISASESKRLFGDKDPVGQAILVDNSTQLQVSAVYEDLPDNSSIDPAMIANFQASGMSRRIYWSNASFETFCLLKNGADPAAVDRKLAGLIGKYIKDDADRWFDLSLQPLNDVHLRAAHIQNTYISRIGDIKTVHQLSLLGLLIVLIASINYMNLATARSEKRSRDVGINKTLGATRAQMIFRFYADAALTTLLAVLVGFTLSFGTIYLFNSISDSHLHLGALLSWQLLLFMVSIWVTVTILAGSYPALLLSRSSALQLMQKRPAAGGVDRLLRKALVVLQFSCSIALIIAVVIIYQQMTFIGNKNLGFSPSGVMMINISGIRDKQNLEGLSNAIKRIPAVQQVAELQSPPGFSASQRGLRKADETSGPALYTCYADAEVVSALGLHLLAGSTLPDHLSQTDSMVYVVANKKVVDYLGWTPTEAIGRKVDVGLGNNAIVVGVVGDFNFMSLKRPIEPYVYYAANGAPESMNAMIVKLRTDGLIKTMDDIRTVFAKTVPSVAFDYGFLDARMASLYNTEKVIQKTILLFSVLAIIISCLGLFGLSAFMAERRTKEIGIRKVLGASSFSIGSMLSFDFLKLVFLSVLIGIPLSIYLMQKWLNRFEYRIHITWFVVALAAICGLLIALLTVSYQSVRAARSNPLKSIKTE